MAGSRMMPALFIGHGSPMNAIEDNEYTRSWAALAASIPRPEAVLCISAHWQIEGTAVTAMDSPKTIHDFYGFPDSLYAMGYRAKGSPALAKSIASSIRSVKVHLDSEWGLDHGAWSVLARMYPQADIPVLQLSLDYNLDPAQMHAIGRELRALRSKGVLLLGSGNLVHNLMAIRMDGPAYPWAEAFDAFVKEALHKRDDDALVNYAARPDARLAHPSSEHYLPLMYILGATGGEVPAQSNGSVMMGSLSMRCALFGKGK